MENIPRKAYTYKFKREAVSLVESGESIVSAARTFGINERTLRGFMLTKLGS